MKTAILSMLKAGGLFALGRRATASSLRILCYHGLWTMADPPFGENLFMDVALFRARMRWLAASGYPVLDLEDAVKRLAAGTLPPRAVVITIDDGWASTHSHMLPILEEYRLPATLYLSTWYADRALPVLNVALRYVIERSSVASLDLSGIAPGLDGIMSMAGSRGPIAQAIYEVIDAMPASDRAAAFDTVSRRAGMNPGDLTDQFRFMTAAEIADAHRRGLRIELHTHRHRSAILHVHDMGGEIDANRAAIRHAGVHHDGGHFCYPGGYHGPEVEPVLASRGILSATLTERGLNPPGTHPYRLRRLLDGWRVSQIEFEAWLSGLFEPLDRRR